MAYPSGATDRIRIDPNTLEILLSGGVKTTKRTRRMIIAARFLFKLRGGGTPPKIVQGGWRPTTDYSKDTHGEDAIDFGTKLFSEARSKLWERCLWTVGFASWRRVYIAGLWSAHTHALPKGGQLSDGADGQIKQWYQGDDALRSDRDYPGILTSGLVARTFETWREISTGGHILLMDVRTAFRSGDALLSNDIRQIQERLNLYMGSSLAVDGIPGRATKGIYQVYQSRLYNVPVGSTDADGLPGMDSLSQLGFEVVGA
jgi:hypothetical protein